MVTKRVQRKVTGQGVAKKKDLRVKERTQSMSDFRAMASDKKGRQTSAGTEPQRDQSSRDESMDGQVGESAQRTS